MRKTGTQRLSGPLILLAVGAFALGCEPPPNGVDGPVTLQMSPATFAASAAGDPSDVPAIAYSVSPFPFTTFAYFTGMPMNSRPSNIGAPILDCTVSPALPAGLSLSPVDCSISGTPSAVSAAAFYRVSARGSGGTSKITISLSVSTPGAVMNIPKASYVVRRSQAMAPIVPQFGGSATASGCSGGFLPTGVTTAGNCTTQGTPTSVGSFLGSIWTPSGTTTFTNFLVPFTSPSNNIKVSITVVSSTQPLVLLDGETFGQASFTAGVDIYPIIPESEGAAITDCTVAPALPAGLSISPSDCSIRGTPTAASAPAVYTLTPKNGSTSGNTLKVTISVKPSSVQSMSCQSDTLCVHSSMPVWSQGDPQLRNYVNTQGYSVPYDPGWCGGVSSAQIIKTYLQERPIYSNYLPAGTPSPYTGSESKYEFMYKTMVLVGTDIQNGGTYVPNNGFSGFFGGCGNHVDFYFTGWSPLLHSTYVKPSQYRTGIPMAWMAISNAAGGHAISLNGVEGGYFKIYDPWGSVFNASITPNSSGETATISYVSGSTYNDVSYYGGGISDVDIMQWISRYAFVTNGPVPTGSCQ